jgi:hypothetical protein
MQQLSEIDKAYKKQDDNYVDGLIEQLNKTQEERIKDAIEMFGVEEYERMTGAKLPHKIEELDCGTGSGGFKAGNTCSKGGDGSKPPKDAPTKDVEEKKGALRRIAEGAKVKAQYGASKAGEIKDYLQSPAGRDLRDNISKALKIAYKGGIESVASVQSHRYKILIGALINPALGGELIAGAGIAGFIKGAVKEYNSQQGRTSSKGIARFQAMGSVVTLARTPSDSEIADYITDEILVAIKEAVTNQKDFCVTTSFEYDPLQNRDESGKWTGGGDSARGRGEGKSGVGEGYTSIKQEAEWVYSKILDNPNLEMDRPENQREAKQWSEAVAKDGLGADTSVELQNKSDEMINVIADYTGSGSILLNKRSREAKDGEAPLVVAQKADTLDKAIKIFPNNEEPTLYRGMAENQASHLENKTISQTKELASTLQVGSEFVDKGFVSTSKELEIGDQFTKLADLYANFKQGDGSFKPPKEIKTYNSNGTFGKIDGLTLKKSFGISSTGASNFFDSGTFKKMAKDGAGFLLHPSNGNTASRIRLTISNTKGRGMEVPRFMNSENVQEREVILPRKSRFRVTEIERVPLYQSNLTGTKKPKVVGNLVSAKVELL